MADGGKKDLSEEGKKIKSSSEHEPERWQRKLERVWGLLVKPSKYKVCVLLVS